VLLDPVVDRANDRGLAFFRDTGFAQNSDRHVADVRILAALAGQLVNDVERLHARTLCIAWQGLSVNAIDPNRPRTDALVADPWHQAVTLRAAVTSLSMTT
jgi:hypothetical protein